MHQSPEEIVCILLFRENGNLILLHGEREKAPHVDTLVGGNVGDSNNNLDEKRHKWITALREANEELDLALKLVGLDHVFDLACTLEEKPYMVHVVTSTISDREFNQLKPPSGSIATCDIKTLDADEMKNHHCPVSPLHNYIVHLFKEHGYSQKYHETDREFISLKEFSQAMAPSLQSSLQPG